MPEHRRLQVLGVVGSLMASLGAGAAYALSQPLYGTADESAHANHAYNLWHGHLVRSLEPMTMPQLWGFRAPFDWTAQHPPLFYVLEAPLVGPLTDAGRLLAAGYAGRALSAVFAGLLVLAVMWAARGVAPKRPDLMVAAGVLTAISPMVVPAAGLILNDTLFAMWAALLVGQTARMVRSGITTPGAAVFALAGCGALGTRLPGAVFIIMCAGALTLAWLITGPRRGVGMVRVVAACVAPVVVNAWFYLRNREMTGNLAGARPDLVGQPGPGKNRTFRSFPEAVADPTVWKGFFATHGFDLVDSNLAAAVLLGFPLAVALAVAIALVWRRRAARAQIVVGLLFLGLVTGVLVLQLHYVAGGGGASWRYIMPVVVATSIATGWVLTLLPRLVWLSLPGWVAATFVPFAAFVAPPNDGAVGSGLTVAPMFPVEAGVALVISAVGVGLATVAGCALAARRGGAGGGAGAVGPRRAGWSV